MDDCRRQRVHAAMELLLRFTRAHRRAVERTVSRLGVHGGQHRILMRLSNQGSLPAQKDLARCMDITPASVANMLKKLESGGYIARSVGCSDGRCNAVEITEQGRRVAEETKRLFDGVDRRVFEGFSDEELARFTGYAERIYANIRALEEELEGGSPDE